jgi:hypothetical protein
VNFLTRFLSRLSFSEPRFSEVARSFRHASYKEQRSILDRCLNDVDTPTEVLHSLFDEIVSHKTHLDEAVQLALNRNLHFLLTSDPDWLVRLTEQCSSRTRRELIRNTFSYLPIEHFLLLLNDSDESVATHLWSSDRLFGLDPEEIQSAALNHFSSATSSHTTTFSENPFLTVPSELSTAVIEGLHRAKWLAPLVGQLSTHPHACHIVARVADELNLSFSQGLVVLRAMPSQTPSFYHPLYGHHGFSSFLYSLVGQPTALELEGLRMESERLKHAHVFANFSIPFERQALQIHADLATPSPVKRRAL